MFCAVIVGCLPRNRRGARRRPGQVVAGQVVACGPVPGRRLEWLKQLDDLGQVGHLGPGEPLDAGQDNVGGRFAARLSRGQGSGLSIFEPGARPRSSRLRLSLGVSAAGASSR